MKGKTSCFTRTEMSEERTIRQIGPYRLLSLIAEGGMADVYLAQKEEAAGLQRTVAVKRIRPDLVEDAQFTARFIDEARISLELQHPNLIRVYGFEKIDGELLLVMEYIDGCNLCAIQNRIMPATAFRSLAIQTADALAALHAIGVMHRDVSPSNILIDRKGNVKLSDLGIAAALHNGSSYAQDFGKSRYLSPAVLSGRQAGAGDDMYSLALLLAESAAGNTIDNACAQADIKFLVPRIRKAGMEREAALLMRASGLSGKEIGAAEFAAAMRDIGASDRRALADMVAAACDIKPSRDLTLPLSPSQQTETIPPKALRRNNSGKTAQKVLLLTAGSAIALILTAVILRTNNNMQSEKILLPENPAPQMLESNLALLPLDAKPRAIIAIDGEEKGSTPLRLKLAPGMHQIDFIWQEKSGGEEKFSRQAFLHSGPNKEIFASIKKAGK